MYFGASMSAWFVVSIPRLFSKGPDVRHAIRVEWLVKIRTAGYSGRFFKGRQIERTHRPLVSQGNVSHMASIFKGAISALDLLPTKSTSSAIRRNLAPFHLPN